VQVEVVIRTENDFYEPLNPYGHWEVIAPFGRCWVPARVETDWRPYCYGHWERTEDSWYWASDEPWVGRRIIMDAGISTRGLDGFGFRRSNGRRRGFAGGAVKGMSAGRR